MNSKAPLKKFGQHFLTDPTVQQKMVSYSSEPNFIIEIGPGTGALTQHLVTTKIPLFLIEKDPRMIEEISNQFNQGTIQEIFESDAAQFDPFVHSKVFRGRGCLISNLPYNASVPITRVFLTFLPICEMRLMYQKEVAQRFLLPEDSKKISSSLSALFYPFFDIDKICNIPPGAFFPPPKVQSQALRFVRKNTPLLSIEEVQSWEKFLRACFQQPRKTLKSNLKTSYDLSLFNQESEIEAFFSKRAEALSSEELLRLFNSRKEYLI